MARKEQEVVYRLKCNNCGLLSDPMPEAVIEQAMDVQKYPDAVNQEFRCSKGCGTRGSIVGKEKKRNWTVVEENK